MTRQVRLSDRAYMPESEKEIDKNIRTIKDNLTKIENAQIEWKKYCKKGLKVQDFINNIPESVKGLIDIKEIKERIGL